MFNDLIGKNKELGRFLFCERYTLPPVKNAMYIAEGQDLKRGAVVDVNGVLVGTNSLMPYAVLEFDCDTRSGGKEASVFIKGEFNFDKLYFASGLSKSDMDNIVYNGSGLGIVIKPYEYAEGFSPLMVPAGTSQSNPLMNAEETERMINAMKPIDDMTLRFEFSKKDYNPETAGVGSTGTWAKVDSPTLNIWDWTNAATDWTSAFQGAFTDADNEVSVIATGDVSSVTSVDRLFAGSFTGYPNQDTYSLSSRNNVKQCCDIELDDSCSAMYVFCGTSLNKVCDIFNASSVTGAFADTMIQEIQELTINSTNCTALFARNVNLERVGNIYFSADNTTKIPSLLWCDPSVSNKLEYIEGIHGTGKVQSFSGIFNGLRGLKIIASPIDCNSATNLDGMFNHCNSLERIPRLENVDDSQILTAIGMFSSCFSITDVPLFDTSHATNLSNMLNFCTKLRSIPDYDFSSVTKVDRFCRNCYKVSEGILETYNKFLDRGASITSHTQTFLDCGRDTPQGRAALSQIPASWGGLAAG